MKHEYTPGPWKVSAYKHRFEILATAPNGKDELIAKTVDEYPPLETVLNNALLMASAPMLFSLVQRAFERFTDNDMMPPNDKLERWLDDAKQVFEKFDE